MNQTSSPLRLDIPSDWEIIVPEGCWRVGSRTVTIPQAARLTVAAPAMIEAVLEKYDSLPVFKPDDAGWVKGAHLKGVHTEETTAKFSLDPASLELFADPNGKMRLEAGVDYAFDPEWGTFGRIEGGKVGVDQPVYASYRCGWGRLDGLFLSADGKIYTRCGEAHPATPQAPAAREGETLLANLWISARLAKLTQANLFPILEETYPEEAPISLETAKKNLPQTMRKLLSGEKLRILAWGDSVTDAVYVPDPSTQRWQEQFVRRLRARYPQAQIELVNLGWGGRNTASFLAEPPGSPYNYQEKVLGSQADLIVSEFVNDANLSPAEVEERYSKLLADFQGIGAEWIILTPHYVRPDWMDLDREKDIDDDPRPYVAGLRAFSERYAVPLADAAKRWGRLWRQGIPYTTLFSNSINHPIPKGLALFADALMKLFPE